MREKSEMTFMFCFFCAYGESDKTAKGRIFLIIYTVKPGDTVTSLAAAYGLDVSAVINDNGLPPDGQLVVGQSLALLFPEEVYTASGGEVRTLSNHSGGICGGLTTGMPVVFRAAFKPTPSIARPQRTVALPGPEETTLTVGGRHDPCVVPRAVPVVEAAAALTMYDLLLCAAL